jgi:hypothetical protein
MKSAKRMPGSSSTCKWHADSVRITQCEESCEDCISDREGISTKTAADFRTSAKAGQGRGSELKR